MFFPVQFSDNHLYCTQYIALKYILVQLKRNFLKLFDQILPIVVSECYIQIEQKSKEHWKRNHTCFEGFAHS